MVPTLLRCSARLLLLAAALYACFFVELGDRSFGEHVARIARTPEARELGAALEASATELVPDTR